MKDDFRQKLEGMRALVQSIDERLANGNIPRGDVENLKVAIDDLRLRIWSSLTAASANDPAVIQRFRLRRAAEMCSRLTEEVADGTMPVNFPEMTRLRESVQAFTAAQPADG